MKIWKDNNTVKESKKLVKLLSDSKKEKILRKKNYLQEIKEEISRRRNRWN
jgi:hypothetical protein